MKIISQLHRDKLIELEADEVRLPGLKEEMADLRYDVGIVQRKHNEIKARDIRKEIDRISTARDKYYLMGIPLMYKAKNDTTAYNRFRSLVDPSYTFTVGDDDETYCYNCKEFRVVPSDGVAVCPKCYSQVYRLIQQHTTGGAVCGYQRLNYFRIWLEQIQGKESLVIPNNVIDIVKAEIGRKSDSSNVTEADIIKYLRKHRAKFYDHCTKILWMVTGAKPLWMTREMEENLESLFISIQDPFERYRGKRKKFFSYAYILYKMCELLGYTEFLPKLFMHKNKRLVHNQDTIWKKICEETGLEFIGTSGL